MLIHFGKRLRKLRKLHGYTLDDLASVSGISRAYIWKLERQGGNPSLQCIIALAKGLGESPGALIDASTPESARASEIRDDELDLAVCEAKARALRIRLASRERQELLNIDQATLKNLLGLAMVDRVDTLADTLLKYYASNTLNPNRVEEAADRALSKLAADVSELLRAMPAGESVDLGESS